MINRYLNILLIFATFFISSDTEIPLFENSGISIEIILLAFSFFLNLLSIKKIVKNKFSEKFIYIISLLVLFGIVLIKDVFLGNYRTFYSIVFLLLLYSFIILKFYTPENINTILIISISFFLIKSFLFPEQLEGYDYLDSVDEGRTYRLRIMGFESNAAGVIFTTIYVYCLSRLKYSSSIVEKTFFSILIILSIALIIKTFSRAAYLSLLISTFFIYFKEIKFYLLSIPLLLFFTYWFYSNNLISPLLIDRFLDSYDPNNPRIANWNIAYSDFINHMPISFFFGIGFFKHAIDNTYLNLLFSLGFFNFILFFFFIFRIFFLSIKNKYSRVIIFILFFNFIFIDFFAQRKILLIAFILIASLELKLVDNKIEFKND